MKQIPLTQAKSALVDDEDYNALMQFKWYVACNKKTFYAARHLRGGTHFMHRQIMGLIPGDKRTIDHRDGNQLNNQKSNLRFCTQRQNCRNQKPRKGCSSRYKGVSWEAGCGKWRAIIKNQNKPQDVGYFKNEIDAARAYDQKAKELFGEFAWLNFPLEEK